MTTSSKDHSTTAMRDLAPVAFFIGQYRGRFALLLAVAFVAAAAEGFATAGLYPLITLVLGGTLAGGGTLLQALGRLVEPVSPELQVAAALGLFTALVIGSAGAQIARGWLTAHVATLVTYDVKQRLFRRLVGAPYLYMLSLPPGQIIYRLTVAAPYLANTLLVTAVIGSVSLTIGFILVLLFSIEWRVTAAILMLGVAFFVVNRYTALAFLVRAGRRRFDAANAEASIVAEFAGGYREIAIARSGDAWARRFAEQGDIVRRQLVKDVIASVTPGVLLQVAVMIAIGLAAVLLRVFAPDALASALPVVAVYALAVRQLLGLLMQLNQNWLRLGGIAPDIRLLQRSLLEPFPPQREGKVPVPAAWKAIDFDHVSFTYPGRDEPALGGVTFAIERGKMTAVVGPSGSGKTTLVNLLARLLEPTAGQIRLGPVDLLDIDNEAWLLRVGYVAQDGFVHDATVRENIAFGRVIGRDAIERAANAAYASEFIEDLPDGYETRLGDRGLTLSAGQRQRLLIARALAGGPELLILDEATAALDTRSELMVHEALTRLRQRCTLVVVAHRLSTIRGADRIVVLERGHVTEQGLHDTLLGQEGTYAQLLRTQERAPASS